MCSAGFVPSVTLLVSALHTTGSTFATEDRMVTSPVLMESCVPQSKPVVWFFHLYFVSRDFLLKSVSNKIGCIFISSEKPELVEFSAVINLKTKCRSDNAVQLSVAIFS